MFIFRLRACAGLKGQSFEDVLDLSKDKDNLNAEANKWLFFLLSTSTSEGALRLIMEGSPGDGRQAFMALQDQYGNTGPERCDTFITEFFALQWENLSQFRQHFNRLIKSLTECKCIIPLQMQRIKCLRALPLEYNAFVMEHIKSSDQSMADLFSALATAERFISASKAAASTVQEAALFASNTPRHHSGRPMCTHCKRPGPWIDATRCTRN